MFRAASDPPAGPHPLSNGPPAGGRGTVLLRRWLLATAVAMFPLIWFGGLTTSHGAGLAVPDWPNTYGYNMFAVPFSVWLSESAGGIFFEHTHRLLGSLTGLLAIGAALWAWGVGASPRARWWWSRGTLVVLGVTTASAVLMVLDVAGAHRLFGQFVGFASALAVVGLLGFFARHREPRRWVRWSATALLAMIILQGVLGGLRVTEVNLELAIVHGVFAQVTFCFAGFLVLACGRWWDNTVGPQPAPEAGGGSAPRLLAISASLTLLVFAQLIVAAVMRHYQAGLAVPDFPLSYGRLLPPVSGAGLERANELRVYDLSLPATSLGLIWLHTAHRVGAVIITAVIAWLAWGASGARLAGWARRHIALLIALLVVQLGLGMTTIWMRKPADIATAHVAVGALFLLTSWLLTVRLWRARRAGAGLSHQNAPDPWHVKASAPWHERQPRQSAAHAPAPAPLSP